MVRTWCRAVLLGLAAGAPATAADVVFENPRFRAVLGEDAVWGPLVEKRTGRDYCAAEKRVSFRSKATMGRPRAMYSRILFMVDESFMSFLGSGLTQTSAVER